MIRGVFFRMPRKGEIVLWRILKCVDIEQYSWHSIKSQNEVWDFNEDKDHPKAFFESDYYNGKSFLQRIQYNHFIIFLKLQAYFDGGEFFHIHTYEEFENSDCQLLLLIWDCDWVSIYVKDQAIVEAIYKNALANNFTEVEYITDSNDGRTGMDIL